MRTAAILLLASSPAWGFDWGGSAESSTAGVVSDSGKQYSVAEVATTKLWANWTYEDSSSLLVRALVTDNFSKNFGADQTLTNSITANLDYLVYNKGTFWIGRTDFRDFGGTLLNTKLDGVQYVWYQPGWELKTLVGTSAGLFKSGSTIFISEDDVKDRAVLESWSDPSTLLAPPRIVGDIEISLPRWVTDQVFTVALVGQFDARPGEAKDGEVANIKPDRRKGAPVSTAYLGVGGQGRLTGSLYWRAQTYLCGGTSLTLVGPIETVNTGTGTNKDQEQVQTWKNSYILSGMGSVDITLLVPEWNFLLVDLGLMAGTSDKDGPSPDQNQPVRPEAKTPSLYTGWVQISQTAGILIFNPQPVNLFMTTLSASIKPSETVQLVANNYVFYRTAASGITESGVDPKSSALFLGLESDVAVFWRPTSDLGASFAGGVFVPSNAMTRSVETKLQATVSLSF